MASIHCAHCTNIHTSVAEVRACASEQYFTKIGKTLASERARSRVEEPLQSSSVATAIGRGSLKFLESQVEAGRYAVGDQDATKFYKIDKPSKGRWSGYTFVKVQASDELYSVRRPGCSTGDLVSDPRAGGTGVDGALRARDRPVRVLRPHAHRCRLPRTGDRAGLCGEAWLVVAKDAGLG